MSLWIVAFDLSLSATGVADENGTRTLTSKAKDVERLADLQKRVLAECSVCTMWGGFCGIDHGPRSHPDLVVIEGYSMGPQRGSQGVAQALGELGGVVKLALWEAGIPFVLVSPSSLKKFACGKGNASKNEVLTAATRRLGYQGSSYDEADASWLWTMAHDYYTGLKGIVPESHRAAHAKVAWPELPDDEPVTAQGAWVRSEQGMARGAR